MVCGASNVDVVAKKLQIQEQLIYMYSVGFLLNVALFFSQNEADHIRQAISECNATR